MLASKINIIRIIQRRIRKLSLSKKRNISITKWKIVIIIREICLRNKIIKFIRWKLIIKRWNERS